MKKIKLNKLEVLDSTLTREQLKGIMGGSSSSSGGTGNPCVNNQGAACKTPQGKDGKCKYMMGAWCCYAE